MLNQKIKETISYMKREGFIIDHYSEEELAEYLGWIMYNKPNVIQWIFKFFQIETHPQNPERLSLVSGSIQNISEKKVQELLANINYEEGLKQLRTKKYIHGMFRKVDVLKKISLKKVPLNVKSVFSKNYKFCHNSYKLNLFISAQKGDNYLEKSIKFNFLIKMENLTFYSISLNLDEKEIEEVGLFQNKIDFKELISFAVESMFFGIKILKNNLYSNHLQSQLETLRAEVPADLAASANKMLSTVLLTKYIDVSNPQFLVIRDLDNSTINENLFFSNVLDKKKVSITKTLNSLCSVKREYESTPFNPFLNPFKRNRLIFNKLLQYVDQYLIVQIILPNYFFSQYVKTPDKPRIIVKCSQFVNKEKTTISIIFTQEQMVALKNFIVKHLENFIISRSLSDSFSKLIRILTTHNLLRVYLHRNEDLTFSRLLQILDPEFTFSDFLFYLLLSNSLIDRFLKESKKLPQLIEKGRDCLTPFIVDSLYEVSSLYIKGKKLFRFLGILIVQWLPISASTEKVSKALESILKSKSSGEVCPVLVEEIAKLSLKDLLFKLIKILKNIFSPKFCRKLTFVSYTQLKKKIPIEKKYFAISKVAGPKFHIIRKIQTFEKCSFPVRTKSGLKMFVLVKKYPKGSPFPTFQDPLLYLTIFRNNHISLLFFSEHDLFTIFKIMGKISLKDPQFVSQLQEICSNLSRV